LPRCADGASGKTTNGNCLVPPITKATTCSPSRTAARRALGRSETCGADAPWARQTLEPRAAQRRQGWPSVDRRGGAPVPTAAQPRLGRSTTAPPIRQ
jgi:hypothetical protein